MTFFINPYQVRTADILLQKGFNVLLHGRNPTKLAKTLSEFKSKHPQNRIESVTADFNNLEDVPKIPEFIKSNHLRVTVFINNVASTDNDLFLFEENPESVMDKTLNTGVVFFTKLCYRIVPILKEVNGKTIMVNIGSGAGNSPVPYLAVYSGTKGYVLVRHLVEISYSMLTSSTSLSLALSLLNLQ